MKTFEFNGDWEFPLPLPHFYQVNAKWREEHKGGKKASENLTIKIMDERTYDPDPSDFQLKTLQYIIDHEAAVIADICGVLDRVNQDHAEWTGDDDWFPPSLTPETLGQVLWIHSLTILTEHKDGFAYFQLDAEYKGDYEHGLVVVIHRDRLIEHSGMGDMNYEGLYIDLQDAAATFRAANISNQKVGAGMVHQVISKYGKYKPWQLDAMANYFSDMLRTKRLEELQQVLTDSDFDFSLELDYDDRNLLDLVVYYNCPSIVAFLVAKGSDPSHSIWRGAHHTLKKEIVQSLIENGATMDSYNQQGMTPLQQAILWYAGALLSVAKPNGSNSRQHERAIAQREKMKDHIQFYRAMGADPEALTSGGENYRTLLEKNWPAEQLAEYEIVAQIEAIL